MYVMLNINRYCWNLQKIKKAKKKRSLGVNKLRD